MNDYFTDTSVFVDSPFGQYWEKRIPPYAEEEYGPGLALGDDFFRFFDLSRKISQTQAALYHSQIIENWDDIKFLVYAHPDGEQVLKDYASDAYRPKDDEVIFFIETDGGKFDFGKIVRVKLGKNAINKLKFQFPLIGQTDEEKLAEAFLKRPFEIKAGKEYQFYNQAKIEVQDAEKDIPELKNLLAKAINYDYSQKKFDDMSWFLIFLQGEEWIGLNTPKKLMEISQWMRTKKYEEEKYWNAYLKDKFTPAFLPQFLVEDNQQKREKAIRELVKSKIDELVSSKEDDGITGKVYKQILRAILLYLLDCYYQAINIAGVALPETEVLYNLNAFLVGLWNGCVEFVAGMIDLVALSMVIARDGIGYTMTDALAEKFENLLNEVAYNFEAFIKRLWEKFLYAINRFPEWFQKYGSNSYYWYKKLGELTPDIITLLAPELKAGEAGKLAEAAAAKEAAGVSEEMVQKSARGLSERLEQDVAQKETKESFKEAETNLEDRIPEEKKIEEIKIENITKPSKPKNPFAKPGGRITKIPPLAEEYNKISLELENEAAEILAKGGYDIEQNPIMKETLKNPDYKIEGKIFDCYSPSNHKVARGVWTEIAKKVEKGQAKRVVINLKIWEGDIAILQKQFSDWSIEGLEEVMYITKEGKINHLKLTK